MRGEPIWRIRQAGKINQRGFVVLMLAWSIAAVALMTQVSMVQGIGGLRVSQWQQQDVQARQFAEAEIDAIINFFQTTPDQSCLDWQKPTFSVLDLGLCTTSSPCTCNTNNVPVNGKLGLSSQITSAKLNFRSANNSSSEDIMLQYRVLNTTPTTKRITVRAFRDATSPNPRAIAEISALIGLRIQVNDGLVSTGGLDVGYFGDIMGNITTFGTGIDTLHIHKNTWVKGKVMIGKLSDSMYINNDFNRGLDPAKYSLWLGSRQDLHTVVLGDAVGLMTADPYSPINMTQTQRRDSIASNHGDTPCNGAPGCTYGNYNYLITSSEKTVADMTHIYTGAEPSPELQATLDAMNASTYTTDQILINAGINPATCTQNIGPGNITDNTTVNWPQFSSNTVCFNSIRVPDNVTLNFRVPDPSQPLKMYIRGSIASNPEHAFKIAPFSNVRLVNSSGTPIHDGIKLIVANTNYSTNKVEVEKNITFYGSIVAPNSYVDIGPFNDIEGKLTLAKTLKVHKNADSGVPGGGSLEPTFRVTRISGWIERPDPSQ